MTATYHYVEETISLTSLNPMFAFCLYARIYCLDLSAVVADVKLPIVYSDKDLPPLVSAIPDHTNKTRGILRIALCSILHVLPVTTISKIKPAVVELIAVDVIYLKLGPLTGHHHENDPMRLVARIID